MVMFCNCSGFCLCQARDQRFEVVETHAPNTQSSGGSLGIALTCNGILLDRHARPAQNSCSEASEHIEADLLSHLTTRGAAPTPL